MALVLPTGLLNRRILVESRSQEMSGGQLVDRWEEKFRAWAQVNPKNSRAVNPSSDGVARAIETYVFRIRYRTDVDAGMRVQYLDQKFEIVDVLQDFAGHIYTDIVCALGGSQG